MSAASRRSAAFLGGFLAQGGDLLLVLGARGVQLRAQLQDRGLVFHGAALGGGLVGLRRWRTADALRTTAGFVARSSASSSAARASQRRASLASTLSMCLSRLSWCADQRPVRGIKVL